MIPALMPAALSAPMPTPAVACAPPDRAALRLQEARLAGRFRTWTERLHDADAALEDCPPARLGLAIETRKVVRDSRLGTLCLLRAVRLQLAAAPDAEIT